MEESPWWTSDKKIKEITAIACIEELHERLKAVEAFLVISHPENPGPSPQNNGQE